MIFYFDQVKKMFHIPPASEILPYVNKNFEEKVEKFIEKIIMPFFYKELCHQHIHDQFSTTLTFDEEKFHIILISQNICKYDKEIIDNYKEKFEKWLKNLGFEPNYNKFTQILVIKNPFYCSKIDIEKIPIYSGKVYNLDGEYKNTPSFDELVGSYHTQLERMKNLYVPRITHHVGEWKLTHDKTKIFSDIPIYYPLFLYLYMKLVEQNREQKLGYNISFNHYISQFKSDGDNYKMTLKISLP